MTDNEIVAPGECLGRGVFSSRDRNRARRSRVPLNVFLEREGEARLSVDRLDVAPAVEAIEIADRVATARNRTFYGWAVVLSETAAASGRRAVASPQLDNPYHADIVLPDPAVEDREEQKRHAQELADGSAWRDREPAD